MAVGPVCPDLPEALLVAVGVDVAVLLVAAACRHEEDRAVVLPAPFQAVELRTALLVALGERAARVLYVDQLRGVRRPDRHPLDRQPLAPGPALAQIDVRLAGDRQHLQLATLGQMVGVVRDIAVEAGTDARARILGLVHDARALVDGRRLVREPAGRDDRHADLKLVRATVDRRLEQVAVRASGSARAGRSHSARRRFPRRSASTGGGRRCRRHS